MDVLTHFKSEKEREITEAQALVDAADADGRALTPEERDEVRAHTARANEFAGKITDIEDNEKLRASISALGQQLTSETEQVEAGHARTIGDAFVSSEGYKALIAAGISGDWRTGQIEYMGAAGDPVLESTGTNADGIPPQWLPGLYTPSLAQEQPSLASLFGQGSTDANAIRYMKVTARTEPASAVTVESQQKPGAEFTFDDVLVTLQKLAAFVPVSEEMLEDSAAVRDYLNAQLPFMVRRAEDKKLAAEIYAAATGVGLSTTIGGTDANGFDAIADAIKDVQINAQVDPDGLFINPTDWWTLAVKKDSVAGQYFSGGPYAGPARNPWGLKAVISNRAPAGFPLVGNFAQGGQVWRKGGIRLEASNSHLDYFRTNLVALRAEVRVALAIYDPAMFSVANLAS